MLSLQGDDFPAALGAFEKAEEVGRHLKDMSPTAESTLQDEVQKRLEKTRAKINNAVAVENRKTK